MRSGNDLGRVTGGTYGLYDLATFSWSETIHLLDEKEHEQKHHGQTTLTAIRCMALLR